MRFTLLLTSFLGIAVALELSRSESRERRTRQRSARPRLMTGVEMRTLEFRSSQRRTGALESRDFYQCTNPELRPSVEDCNAIVSEVLLTDNEVIIAANSCLVYSFGTCQGFFCSLCDTLDTSTQFIGTQLDNVVALCVENGQAGSIVGEDPPQWDSGFTYAGEGLPAFDVC